MKNLWETTTHTNKYTMRVSEEQRERDMKNIERTNGLKHPNLMKYVNLNIQEILVELDERSVRK